MAFRFEDPSLTTSKMNEVIQKDLKAAKKPPVELINPERETHY